MDDAEEDPHFHKLEVIVNDALKQVLGCKEHPRIWSRVESTDESTDLELWASIARFGSRVYALATETSDVDYWLPVPAGHAPSAKISRAHILQFLMDRKLARPSSCEGAAGKDTLSWTYAKPSNLRASINVSDEDGTMGAAMEITDFLHEHYADQPELREFCRNRRYKIATTSLR